MESPEDTQKISTKSVEPFRRSLFTNTCTEEIYILRLCKAYYIWFSSLAVKEENYIKNYQLQKYFFGVDQEF